MARKPQNIKISPKLIEFEDHILRVPNIATVTVGRDPRRVYLAIAVFLVGLSLLGQAFAALLTASNANYGFLILLWLLAIGAFWFARRLYRYRALVISTADGRFTALVDRKPEFARDVMARIREALLAGEGSSIIYQVNVQAEKIERLDANSTVVSNSAGAVVAGGAMETVPRASSSAANSFADILSRAGSQVAPFAGQAFEAAGTFAQRGRSIAEDRIAAMRPARDQSEREHRPTSANSVTVNGAPGAIIAGGNLSIADSTVTTRGSIVNEFDAVMAAVSKLSAEHKHEIIDYLRPVRDHLSGGKTPREEARTRWAWFAANVASAVSGVDGVIAIVERVSRLLGAVR